MRSRLPGLHREGRHRMNDILSSGMARFNFRSASSSKRRIVRMKRF